MVTPAAADVRAEIDAQVAGRTVASEFAEVVRQHPDAVALRERRDDAAGGWHELTWQEYADRACRVAAGLRKLGVGPGDRVALMIRNVADFHVADIAVLLLGATPFSIYNSSAPDQVQYLISHAEAKVAIVEHPDFLERVAKVRDQLPTLATIVLMSGDATTDVVPWDELLAEEPVDLDDAAAIAQPDDLATLIYTSGTTGPPKGVMITHSNVLWTGESLLRAFGMPREELVGMRIVSYLPMAHIAERQTSHYNGILGGFVVTSCPDTGKIAEYLREVRPHVGFGVPRIWEKIAAGVEAALAANPENKAKFDDAVSAATPLVAKRTVDGEAALSDEERKTLAFLDEVAFAPVRASIGMDSMVRAISGAAPIPVELVEWYRAIGVPLSEVYGMSENTGPLTWDAVRVKPGYVGRSLPGVEVALAPDGEVIARGGNIFTGYLNDPAKTAEALDEEGWLHTGDIGEFDDEGYLRIVDRKKELIITAGGKNISPANLEAALKSIPLVGQAAVIGDQRPFMSALLVLDPDAARAWAAGHGLADASLADLAEHPDVVAEVEAGVREANARFSQVEQIKKWKLLAAEWQPDSEELTPTMKLKRRGINAKYATEIEGLYAR
jgi:long-chain acyl-CoA synthetase